MTLETREGKGDKSKFRFVNTSESQHRYLLAYGRKLERIHNVPDPDVLAQEIVEDLEAALEQFREIATDLGREANNVEKR